MDTFFKASLDTVSKIATALVTPLFTIYPIFLFFTLRNEPDKSYVYFFIFLTLFLIIVFLFCFLYWVKGYTISDASLTINRRWKNKSYLFSEIESANFVPKKDMGMVIRIMGNGGLFGYTGYFTSKKNGRMQWFVTNTQKLIVVVLKNGKTICISPDDTNDFLKALHIN